MDLDALRYAQFLKLGEAVADWKFMTGKLKELQSTAHDDLLKKATNAHWAGVNAGVSREFITKTAGEFGDAHRQADTITNILRDTMGELQGYKKALEEAIERGLQKNLRITDTGGGSFRVDMNIHPDRAAEGTQVPEHTQQDVDSFRDEIQGILSKATESDSSANEVLRALVDQVKYGFSDAEYSDRDHAAAALKAAEEMAKMAKHPDKMSLDDIREFNADLKRYHEDPLFAERFSTRVGAKGTLQFWTEMSELHAGARGAELDQMKTMQKNLSMTLATASFSDSDAMRKWKHDLLQETNTSFRADPTNPMKPTGALGYQVISSLMRDGKFDTEFLDSYRKKLIAADKGAGGSDGQGTNDLWKKGYEGIDLVFGKDNGRDPVEGFLDAASHNPEAALHTFDDKSDLNHLLGSSKYTDRGTPLGHALEAAVTGVAHGDTQQTGAAPHSAEQVRVMQNVMNAVAQPGGGGDLVSKQIGESFGHMAAAYMPEISNSLGGPNSDLVYLTDSDDPHGLERRDVVRFLTEVSHDANGRQAIRFGEGIYTGSLLDAHLADPSRFDGPTQQVLQDIGHNAGLIQGIVGHSVADADIGAAVDVQKAENDATQRQGEFFKTVLSTGVGVGSVALVPETRMGALVGAIGGGFFGGVSGMAVDRMYDGKELEGARDMALYQTGQDLNRTQDSVNQQTQWSVEDALKRHHTNLPAGGTSDAIRTAVNVGWGDSSRMMSEVEDRP